ncbi:MAG: xanthine dehydrogenase family protein subunit M [Rhodospirillales bacterium]
MKPKAFDYLRAETAEEAIAVLGEHGEEAKILAGGQSMIAMLNLRLVEPRILVDVSRVAPLAYVKAVGDRLEIGAATTQSELLGWPELSSRIPLLAQAMPHIGHFQTRNKGTVCGSLAHADPSSELPLCLATLNGEVVLRSRRGERTLSADAFQTGMLSTARAADEIVAAARYPFRRAGEGFAFAEVAMRRGDFAIVALAAVATAGGVRLGVGGMADRPALRDWDDLDGSALDDALNAFAWELGGHDDTHATARYRREMVRRLGRRVIEEARACRH